MTPLDNFLPRLDRVHQRGRDQWSARCPAHDDNSPSLSIRQRDDGALLLKCWAGCGAGEVVGAVGLSLSDLFPPRPQSPGAGARPSKLKLPAAQALEIMHRESMLIYVLGSDMHRLATITTTDFDRLGVAVRRVGQLVEAAQ